MADGNDNQQSGAEPSETWPQLLEPSLWPQAPFNSFNVAADQPQVKSIEDIFHALSNVELHPAPVPAPPPPPTLPPRTNSVQVSNRDQQRERQVKRNQDHHHQHSRKTRQSKAHSLSERRRRGRIQEKLNTLKQLVPKCNKTNTASMLTDAIEYTKLLQRHHAQLINSMENPVMPQAPYISPNVHQSMQVPCFSPCVPIGMGYGVGGYDPAYSTGFPFFPTFVPGLHPPLPSPALTTGGIPPAGESRALPIVPQQQFPSRSHQPYPTIPTSATTPAQVVGGVTLTPATTMTTNRAQVAHALVQNDNHEAPNTYQT